MKRFLVISYMNEEAKAHKSSKTSEGKEEGMRQWLDWKDKYGEMVIDLGAPIVKTVKMESDGTASPSSKGAAGYMIIIAEDMEGAVEMLKDSPFYPRKGGFDIEIYEIMEM